MPVQIQYFELHSEFGETVHDRITSTQITLKQTEKTFAFDYSTQRQLLKCPAFPVLLEI